MAVSPDLLAILVCPLCKESLQLVADDTGLKCDECHRIYPIRDDIPVMMPEEARVDGDGTPAPDAAVPDAAVPDAAVPDAATPDKNVD